MMKLIVFTLAAVLAFILPGRELTPIVKSRLANASIVVLGNSAITHRSRCDRDQRTIPMMMADESGRSVIDLSTPGQLIDQSVNVGGYALGNPGVQRIVFTLSLFDLADFDTTPLQEALLHRAWNRGIVQPSLADRLRANGSALTLLTGRAAGSRAPFEYKGVPYPEYEGIKRDFFSHEKRIMGCPETDGADAGFVEAFHFAQYVQLPIHEPLIDMVASLKRLASDRGVAMDVYLLPINGELMRRFDPLLLERLRLRVQKVSQLFRERGLVLTDLSTLVGNEEFADRWCACGHMLQNGRLKVARSLVGAPSSGTSGPTELARALPARKQAVVSTTY